MMDCKEFWTRNTVLGLGLGQLLSLLVTSTGFSSSELAKRGINAPTSQSFLNYVLLALVYGSIMLYRRQALKSKWYYYVLLGIVDVEANFLVVKAYQYTSITSVMLLDCWTIPCVLFLTWFFLKTHYGLKKFLGVAICVAGLVMVVFSDVHSADRSNGSNPVKGDLLVIAGATLYGVSNVSEEYFVKSADRVELMAFLGIFGAIISACQISILEREELKSIHWTAGATFPFVGFSVAMFLFYSGVPILLKISGATMLNLSLLTSDMWAVLIRVFAYHEKVDWMYFIAFAAVAVGLIVYSGGDKTDQNTAEVADVVIEQSKRFDEEAGVPQPGHKDEGGNWKEGLHMIIAGNKESMPTVQAKNQRMIVESLISIIPQQKDSVSCSFLLRLLRMANMLKVAPALVTELEKRVGMQFEQATLADLLIPSYSKSETMCDVDLVQRLLEHFLVQEQSEGSSPSRQMDCRQGDTKIYERGSNSNAKMRVARLVDSYLTEVSRDRHLSLTKFQVLAEALPESTRTCDDGLYRAVDSYLKAHPTLTEHERKRLCRVMDCQKLSMDACMHAAQNERLPLRVVVQVLFSEQVKISNALANSTLKEGGDQSQYQPLVSNRKTLLEGTPQSFQEGWAAAKKDINTLKFELESVKAKYLELQNEMETLQRDLNKPAKPKHASSAWTSGWKKLSKLTKTTDHNDNGSNHGNQDPTRKTTRRWRNSIS